MSSQAVEYCRFHNNESCTEVGCRARRFYIEDGRKFCQRGHEQDGFTQTQQEEDDFIKVGVTSRKKRLVEEHVSIALRDNEAKELFLRCLQLIIWKQCYWLITKKGFCKDFETIVRDLWTLRVGIVWRDESNDYTTQNETDRGFFSSQSELDMTRTGSTAKHSLSKKSRFDEKLPGLPETLVLCYLGMVLLRLPIGLGEVIDWATRYEILYLRASCTRANENEAPCSISSCSRVEGSSKWFITLSQISGSYSILQHSLWNHFSASKYAFAYLQTY